MSVTPEGFRLVEEMLGTELDEVSGVDEPATDRPFLLFKSATGAPGKAAPEGRSPAFERCLDHVMDGIEKGEIEQRGDSPKATAMAICTAGGAGKGTPREAAKEGTMPDPNGASTVAEPGAPAPAGEPGTALPSDEMLAAQVVEIPGEHTPWGFGTCISEAMASGMDESSAIATCQIILTDFGDPEDPETILVPEGSSTMGMLASAALHGGLPVPAKLAPHIDPQIKFTGQSRLMKLWHRFIGKDRPVSPAAAGAREVEGLKKEVAEMQAKITSAQAKTSEDLKEILAEHRRLLTLVAHLGGIELPETETPAAADSASVTTAAVPAPALVEPGKTAPPAAKTEPAPAAKAGDPIEERFQRLEAAVMAIAEKIGATEAPDATGAPVEPTVEAPTKAAPLDPNRFRKSRDPRGLTVSAGTKGNGDGTRISTVLGGAGVLASDRKALGWTHGV